MKRRNMEFPQCSIFRFLNMKKEMKQKMNKSLIEGPASIFWLNEFDSESMEKLIKDFDLDPN